jgi:hypothetical protein
MKQDGYELVFAMKTWELINIVLSALVAECSTAHGSL